MLNELMLVCETAGVSCPPDFNGFTGIRGGFAGGGGGGMRGGGDTRLKGCRGAIFLLISSLLSSGDNCMLIEVDKKSVEFLRLDMRISSFCSTKENIENCCFCCCLSKTNDGEAASSVVDCGSTSSFLKLLNEADSCWAPGR